MTSPLSVGQSISSTRLGAFTPTVLWALLAGSCGVVDSGYQPEAIRVAQLNPDICSAFCVAGTQARLVLRTYDPLSEEGRVIPGVLINIQSLTNSIEVADAQLRTGPDGTAETAVRFLQPVQAAEVRFELPEEQPLPTAIYDRGSVSFTVYPELPQVTIAPDSMVLEEGCIGRADWRITMQGGGIPGLEPQHVSVRSPRIARLAHSKPSTITAVAAGNTSLYVWLEDGAVRFADDMPIRVTPFEPRKLSLQAWQIFLGDPAPVTAVLHGACLTRSVAAGVDLTNHTPHIITYDAETRTLIANSLGVARITAEYGGFADTVEVRVQDYRALPVDTTIASGKSFEYRPQFAVGDTVYHAGEPNWNTRIAYSSSDTSVASVSTREGFFGRVTGLKAGTATITFRVEDRHGHPAGPPRTATVTVTEAR